MFGISSAAKREMRRYGHFKVARLERLVGRYARELPGATVQEAFRDAILHVLESGDGPGLHDLGYLVVKDGMITRYMPPGTRVGKATMLVL